MYFDAHTNHVAGSFMIAVTGTDNPVPASGGGPESTDVPAVQETPGTSGPATAPEAEASAPVADGDAPDADVSDGESAGGER